MERIVLATAGALALAAPAAAEDQRAALLAGACQGCHGVTGRGVHAIPAIAGTMSRDEFAATLRAFRENERSPTVMNRIARGYTDEEVALLAARWAQATPR